jgi:hypothetical protein
VDLVVARAGAFDLAVSVFEKKILAVLFRATFLPRGARMGKRQAGRFPKATVLEMRIFYAGFHVAPGRSTDKKQSADPIPGTQSCKR